MIKQIQLRGISRIPSDRAAADGGCAESLNVHLEQQETAPTLAPIDISDDIYGQLTKHPIIYIHKMLGVTNYIGHILPASSGSPHGFFAYGATLQSNAMGGLIVPYSENVTHITSIGNTLIIFTDGHPYYFIFKDHQYTFLGNEIPKPYIEVITQQEDRWLKKGVQIAEGDLRIAHTGINNYPDVSKWNAAKSDANENHAELLETMENIWNEIKLGMAEKRSQGLFVAPFFIRYALRLYDGSYLSSSAPILCGAGPLLAGTNQGSTATYYQYWASAHLYYYGYEEQDYQGFKIDVRLNNIFKVRLKGAYNMSNWGDIVQSIDIFASSPAYAPNVEAGFSGMRTTFGYYPDGSMPDRMGYDFFFDRMDEASAKTTVKDELLSKGQFFKIKSIDLTSSSDMNALTSGTMTLDNTDMVSGDLLATQDEMPTEFRDAVQYLPVAAAQNFNGRLLLVGAEEVLASGDAFLNGLTAVSSANLATATFRYKIVNPINGSVNYVMSRNRNGGTAIQPGYFYNDGGSVKQSFGDESHTIAMRAWPYAWISYPDTRCTEVEVSWTTTSGGQLSYRLPMQKHPLLECVYAYFGLDTNMQAGVSSQGTQITNPSSSESRKMPNGNKLVLSEFENPFVFPAENIITFGDQLVGAATTSVPLTEGQFGEFPLYAFTEGGIRVLVTTAEGTFAANYAHPNLSRHVALPDTILAMEQAIVFITKQGVMLLSGSQVQNISEVMNGMPYALDDSLADAQTGLLIQSDWAGLIPAATAGETLMAFMSAARVAYDNKGARLLFFNPTKNYQYEYRIDTQTWHKTLSGVTDPTILNSYPDCLVSYVSAQGAKVLNFSTILDDASLLSLTANSVYGLIATRPFDMGEPDVRKSISSIRIRGHYNRADVQYALLGSFDGIHWKRLTSLHGGSYKMFRMVLLTHLAPTERITWIDVDYETRMTNRLR